AVDGAVEGSHVELRDREHAVGERDVRLPGSRCTGPGRERVDRAVGAHPRRRDGAFELAVDAHHTGQRHRRADAAADTRELNVAAGGQIDTRLIETAVDTGAAR